MTAKGASKVLVLVEATPSGLDAARLGSLLLSSPSIADLTVNVVLPQMGPSPLPGVGAPEVPLDALVELTTAPSVPPADAYAAASEALVAAGVGVRGGYRLNEVVQIDYARYWPDGEPTRGPKLIWFARRREGSGRLDFARRWRLHALLARRIHVGLWRYVQGLVLEVYGDADPSIDGVAVTHNRSIRDYLERMAEDEAGHREIAADIAGFTAGAQTYVTQEVILRSATPDPLGAVSQVERWSDLV